MQRPSPSKMTSAPPFFFLSYSRTRSGGSTEPQQMQVAFARETVPTGTSFSDVGSNTSNFTDGFKPL